MTMVDQKAAFQDRVKRIKAGKQYEHADVVGYHTQKAYNRRYSARDRKPRRTLMQRMMVPVAMMAGAVSVLAGRLAYFHMAKIEGLPEAFYDLGSRGMVLFAMIIAGIFVVLLNLATSGRLQALMIGCLLMHFGEAAVAANAQDLWAEIFSADYAAAMAEKGASYRVASASMN